MARTRPHVALLLVCGSLLFCAVVLELSFVPLLPYLPRKLHVYVDEGIRPLAQSSKRAALPRDYVALVGDSYAQGRGDWLLESDGNRNRPFSSAHVLYEKTGRDVISWGRGGASPLSGWVAFSIVSWRALQTSRRTALEPPALLIAYFYEGNDLEDTLADLLTLTILEDPGLGAYSDPGGTLRLMLAERPDFYGRALRNPRLRDPQHLQALLAERLVPRIAQSLGARREGRLPPLYFTRFLLALVRGELARLRGHAPVWEWEGVHGAGHNRVALAGGPVEVPGSFQAAGMELSPEETDLAFYAVDLSIAELAASFPGSAICVVYIPSPAALYEFADEPVSVQALRGDGRFASAAIHARSQALDARLRGVARARGVRFVDAGPPLRAAARGELIHGPRDPRHLNRRGQTVLGESAARCLAAP